MEKAFKFKVTNLRTTAFPGPLDKTDYYGLIVGDYVTKGSENTVYEVVHISREPITDGEYQAWTKENSKYGNQREKLYQDLIDKYKKSGNFGACQVHCKPVIRGGKQIAKGRLVKWLEPNYPSFKYNGYRRTTLTELMTHRANNIANIDYQLMRFNSKKKIQKDAYDILKYVHDLKFPPPPQAIEPIPETANTTIEIVHSGQIAETFEPKMLL